MISEMVEISRSSYSMVQLDHQQDYTTKTMQVIILLCGLNQTICKIANWTD